MLTLEALTIRYPGWEGVYSAEIPAGSLVAVVGPSGGGKSTLLSAIAGFERIAAGRIHFAGKDITALPPGARRVAILFQDHNLFPHLSAFENAALGLKPDLKLTPAERDEVLAALADVELDGKAQARPAQLSGGQRQRVALARALVSTRPVLLLDEPFSALDPGLRRDMIARVDALRRARGLTVLMTLHTPEDALGHADLAAFVADGRIADFGPARDVLSRGRSPAMDAFLG
jgi:thiamine transport system ATP-binding protein